MCESGKGEIDGSSSEDPGADWLPGRCHGAGECGVMRTPGVLMCRQNVFDDSLQSPGVKVVLGNKCFQPLIRVPTVADQEGDDSEEAVLSAGESWGGRCL